MQRFRCLSVAAIVSITALSPATARGEFTEDALKTVQKNVAQEQAVLVDVRSQEEWDEGHLADSIFLPVTRLIDGDFGAAALAEKLPQDKILYTFCVSGARAELAGDVLKELDYQVRVLAAGYEELVQAGFESEKSADSDDDS